MSIKITKGYGQETIRKAFLEQGASGDLAEGAAQLFRVRTGINDEVESLIRKRNAGILVNKKAMESGIEARQTIDNLLEKKMDTLKGRV